MSQETQTHNSIPNSIANSNQMQNRGKNETENQTESQVSQTQELPNFEEKGKMPLSKNSLFWLFCR